MNIVSTFYDPLYGEVVVPPLLAKCLATPEILRLRDIRLSNVKCDQTPGLANTSRFEHIVGCVHLALTFGRMNAFSEKDLYELCIAAIYHDVATPPFGHSFEWSLPNFDHELETRNIIMGGGSSKWRSLYENQLSYGDYPRISEVISAYNRNTSERLNIETIAEYTNGKGKLGCLIKNDLDLDNLDNVTRAAFHSGIKIDQELPLKIVKASRLDNSGRLILSKKDRALIDEWKRNKYMLYDMFLINLHDLIKELYLQYIFKTGLGHNVLTEDDWFLNDSQMVQKLLNNNITSPLFIKLETNKLPELIFTATFSDKDYKSISTNTVSIELTHLLARTQKDCIFICSVKKDRRYAVLSNVVYDDMPSLFDELRGVESPNVTGKCYIYILLDGNMPLKLDAKGRPSISQSGKSVRMSKQSIESAILDYFKMKGLTFESTSMRQEQRTIIF